MKSKYMTTGVILVAVLAGGILFMRSRNGVSSLPAPETGQVLRAKGPADAPVQIIEYSDFECPACQKAQPVLDQILKDYPGKIRIIYHHFPLAGHRWAALAHQAAECMNEQGMFWPYHDRLYAEQEQWSKLPNPSETFLRYAVDLGVPVEIFADCMMSEKVRRRIIEEKSQGESLKVQSTPTFFIGDLRAVGHIELQAQGRKKIESILGPPLAAQAAAPAAIPSDSPAVAQTEEPAVAIPAS